MTLEDALERAKYDVKEWEARHLNSFPEGSSRQKEKESMDALGSNYYSLPLYLHYLNLVEPKISYDKPKVKEPLGIMFIANAGLVTIAILMTVISILQ